MGDLATVDDAIGLVLPADLPFIDWVGMGKGLFDQRRKTDWMLADWWKHGHAQYRDEPQFALLLEQTAADPKRLNAMVKVAEAFPPSQRAASLSFEVHREIAAIDPDSRLEMLHRADTERWTERTAHAHVVEYRYQQGSLLPDDDPENREAVEIIRAWNRASPEARRYFYELAETVAFGCINEGQAHG